MLRFRGVDCAFSFEESTASSSDDSSAITFAKTLALFCTLDDDAVANFFFFTVEQGGQMIFGKILTYK